jgi:hypothetical protein
MKGAESVRQALRHNGLGLFFGVLFLGALIGQAFAGWSHFNDEQILNGMAQVGLGRYLTSSQFVVDVAENWQSEYLQFLLYIWATVWFLQRGSPESKSLDSAGRESDEEQKVGPFAAPDSPAWARRRGWRLTVFSHSLLIVMGTIFVLSLAAEAVAGWTAYNAERLTALTDTVSFGGYLTSAEFWDRTLQNWQSEFLAVASMAILSIYLRERASSESKPVGEPHNSTGVTG